MSENRSIDDILNSSVEDLVDLKEFKPLPVGTYKMLFDWEKSDQPAGVRFQLKVVEILELANQEDAATIEPDAKESFLFMFFNKDGEDSSLGQGRLKKIVNEVLKPVFQGDTLIETLDNAKGAEVVVTIKHRKDKQDPDKVYSELKSFDLAD